MERKRKLEQQLAVEWERDGQRPDRRLAHSSNVFSRDYEVCQVWLSIVISVAI